MPSSRTKTTRRSDHRRRLLAWARRRAKERGIEFDLEPDDLLIPAFCPVLGIPLKPCPHTAGDSSPTLDRLDPHRGYVKGNVIVVSNKANRIKSTADLGDLMRVTAFMQQLTS